MKSLVGISFKTRIESSVLDGRNTYCLIQETQRAYFARCSQSGRGHQDTKQIPNV